MLRQATPIYRTDNPDELASLRLRKRVATAIRDYLERRSVETANAVVSALDHLWQQSDHTRDAAARCGFWQLRAHWQMIAFTNRGL